MIDKQEIQKKSTKFQTSEINVAREYCQHIFLSYFYANNPEVYFKGGTALRIVFNSARFSEDLDFTSSLSINKIEKIMLEALDNSAKEGFDVGILVSKPTSGGYLSNIYYKFLDYNIEISVQVSLRQKKEIKSDIHVISNEYINDYTLLSLNQDNLVEEKIKASIDRKKPRDFYDIYFMLRAGLITPNQRKLLKSVLDVFNTTKINFSTELKAFLPISLHNIIGKFEVAFRNEVGRFVQ